MIAFLTPLGLLALVALPVILILHLIRERRRRATVPSLLLWANLPRQPQGERAQILPLTLLLIFHLLAAALIALALTRPQISVWWQGTPQQLAIVLDTSLSMSARSGANTRIDQARDQIRQLLQSLGGNGQATLISAGPQAQVVASGTPGEIENVLVSLDQLIPAGVGADLNRGLILAEAALDPRRPGQIIVFTDGSSPPPPARALSAPVDWRIVGAAMQNRAIVDFASRPLGAQTYVFLRVANYGGPAQTVRLQLIADDRLIEIRSVSLNQDGETELTWNPPPGATLLQAKLEGRDALPEDDQAYLNLATTRPLQLLLVSDTPEVLRRGLTAVAGVQVTVVSPSNFLATQTSSVDLTVYDGFVPNPLPTGPAWIVNPPPSNQIVPLNSTPKPLAIDNQGPRGALLAGLTLDGITLGASYPLKELPTWARVELSGKERGTSGMLLGDPTPLIISGRAATGELTVWLFRTNDGNLANRLAFPLMVARTVRSLTPGSLPGSLAAGDTLVVRPSPRASDVVLTTPDGSSQRLPAAALVTFDTLLTPGLYQLREQNAAGPLFQVTIPINAGAVIESDMRPQPRPQFTVTELSPEITAQRNLSEIWPWLVIIALIIMLFEWAYLFRRKRAAF